MVNERVLGSFWTWILLTCVSNQMSLVWRVSWRAVHLSSPNTACQRKCVSMSLFLCWLQGELDITSSNARGHDDECIWSDVFYPTCGALTKDANLVSPLFWYWFYCGSCSKRWGIWWAEEWCGFSFKLLPQTWICHVAFQFLKGWEQRDEAVCARCKRDNAFFTCT